MNCDPLNHPTFSSELVYPHFLEWSYHLYQSVWVGGWGSGHDYLCHFNPVISTLLCHAHKHAGVFRATIEIPPFPHGQ